MSRTTWKTKDGIKIPIRELDDNHLKNIIAQLRRNARKQMDRLEYELLAYADGAPDGASMAAESEAMHLVDMDVDEWLEGNCTQWKALNKEAQRRGIIEIPKKKTFTCAFCHQTKGIEHDAGGDQPGDRRMCQECEVVLYGIPNDW